MKIQSLCVLLSSMIMIAACSGGSNGSSSKRDGPPAPEPKPEEKTLSLLKAKVDQFQILLNDYKKCVFEFSQAECAEKAKVLNWFSLEGN